MGVGNDRIEAETLAGTDGIDAPQSGFHEYYKVQVLFGSWVNVT